MRRLAFSAALIAGMHMTASYAASLRVSPVLIDVSAPTSASSIRIWSEAKLPVSVQARLFRWSQNNGDDTYEPATDVVVSPPITSLKPGGENILRIVRTSKRPVTGEESYRLLVDELPDSAKKTSGTINLIVRHSIPVFFSQRGSSDADPVWNIQRKAGGYQVTVSNKGDRRLRISDLVLTSGRKPVGQKNGLVGYVLGHSSASWFVASRGGGGSSLILSAQSETGSISVQTNVKGG